MGWTRRSLIKMAGVSMAGFCIDSMGAATAEKTIPLPTRVLPDPEALFAKRWGMVVDTRKIESSRDLAPIIDACRAAHNIPTLENRNHEIQWIRAEAFENAFQSLSHAYLDDRTRALPFPVLCNHCKNPPCVRVCPTKATYQRESDGVVMMDFHRCIGCRYCMAACPFGARSFNFRDPAPFIEEKNSQFPTRTKGVVEKCNFCAERLAVGKLPACVEASGGILTFGDLDDPSSEARELLSAHYTVRRRESLGTEPNVYYIL